MANIDKLIEENIGLVYTQLHKFNRACDDEAFSYGLEALWKAATTYDSSKSVKFSTYASVCIYNAIAYYLREEYRRKKRMVASLDEPLDEAEERCLADTIASVDTVETDYLQKELYEQLWKHFDAIYNSMTNETSKSVLRVWRESEFTMSQRDIANATGITQSYVSRVLSAFKHKLKKEMEGYLCGK